MRATRSIRFRLALLAIGAGIVAVLFAAGLVLGVHATDIALERAIGAQRRLDLLTRLSARFSDYGLVAVDLANATGEGDRRLTEARTRVERALSDIAVTVEQTLARPGDAQSEVDAAVRSRPIAHITADFSLLDTQIRGALRESDGLKRADTIRGALNSFAAGVGPPLSFLVEAEQRAVTAAREEARRRSGIIQTGAVIAALLALVVLVAMHRRITGPLLARIGAIEKAAVAIGRGELDTRIEPGSRDELGLLVARFNRMAARLSRRERRLADDRAALEQTVEQRTAALTAANERLTAIDNSRRRFFADVSHELRTPLTVILGECDLALRGLSAKDERLRNTLATIRGRALRLHRRVEDLLRIARSESGRIELALKEVSLHEILEEAVDSFAKPARRRHVALRLEEASADLIVVADREWLRQVIEGLIDNALQHAAGVTAITVAAEDQPDHIEITVADDGCGIPPEVLPSLFERFSRIPGSGETGFGIGLALARWVIEHHGGTITLSTNESAGHGTSVTLTLPRADQRT